MEELRHLEDVEIEDGLPVEERVASFVGQIGDPYHFMAGGTEVRIAFAGQIPVQDAVARLLGVGDAPLAPPAPGPAGASAA